MKLHGDLISPFVRMSMATAIECGLGGKVQLVSAVVKPQLINPELSKLSPIGKIPVLETDHGHPLHDSRVIMEYFCHVAGNKSLLPDEGLKHFRVLASLALMQGIGDAAVQLRYETFARPEAQRWPELADRLRARIASGLKTLDAHLAEHLEGVTLASMACGSVLAYIDIRQLMPQWQAGHEKLAQWQMEFAKRPCMIETQPKT